MLHRKRNGDSPCPFLLRPRSDITDRTKRGLGGARTHAPSFSNQIKSREVPRHHIGNARFVFVLRPHPRVVPTHLHPSAPEPTTPAQKRERKTQMQEKKTTSSSSRAHPTSCISSPDALRGIANPSPSDPQTGPQPAASAPTTTHSSPRSITISPLPISPPPPTPLA
ncbi:hypothetical protein K438DRAFT_1955637 [Mycena galopus ATCC 62051]|nr:hypothetical protein K438DRAFT_1955637 [Mycena galopus ATCC 62051]